MGSLELRHLIRLLGAVAVLSASPRPAAAQELTSPQLLRDINTTPPFLDTLKDSSPFFISTFGSHAVFSATSKAHGREPWVTDGTSAGTFMLADVVPGKEGSFPEQGVAIPGKGILYFGLTGTLHPLFGQSFYGLLLADPVGGTVQVVADDIEVGTIVSGPEFVEWQGEAWFFADDGISGCELWRSDGTQSGTGLAFDAVAGAGGAVSFYDTLTVAGGSLFFTTSQPTDTLWVLPSPGGTPAKLWEATPAAQPSPSRILLEAGGKCLFSIRDAQAGLELGVSDGTVGGTSLLADLELGAGDSTPIGLASDGNRAWFTADVDLVGRELFVSDGTPAGTGLVADVLPGPSNGVDGSAGVLTTSQGLFFAGADGPSTFEPWFTDGTAPNTYRIADLEPGAPGSSPGGFVEYGGVVYFQAVTSSTGKELFRTDGTGSGTGLAVEFEPGPASSLTYQLGVLPSGILVPADTSGTGDEPWFTQGTTSSTFLLADIHTDPLNQGSSPLLWDVFRGRLFFRAASEAHGFELWTTDGTLAGTSLFLDILPGPSSSFPRFLGLLDHGFVFAADDGISGTELWFSDGTTAGTSRISDIAAGSAGIDTYGSVVHDGAVFCVLTIDGGSAELWRTDGTSPGTAKVAALPENPGATQELTSFGSHVWFRSSEDGAGAELWWSDGTSEGTGMVADIWPGFQSGFPTYLTVFGDHLWFQAATPDAGAELWRADSAGAVGVFVDLVPGPDGSSPWWLMALDDVLFFGAESTTGGLLPWVTDGTLAGTLPLGGYTPASSLSGVSYGVRAGDHAFFFSSSSFDSAELWSTDGTATSTALVVSQTSPGDTLESERIFALGSGENVVFASEELASGRELWTADALQGLLGLVSDLHVGPLGSVPEEAGGVIPDFVRVGAFAVWPADDGTYGFELYAAPIVDLGGWVSEPFGTGCGSARIGSEGAARLGQAFHVTVEGQPVEPALLFWSADQAFLDIAPGCQFAIGAPAFLTSTVTDAHGTGVAPFVVPTQPTLVGVPLFFQWATLELGGPILGVLDASDGLEVVIGA